MAGYPPKKNAAYVFMVGLVSQADTKLLKVNPTLAAGDVKVQTDDGTLANITTLPTGAAGSTRVKVSLSAAEMNGDNVYIQFVDAAGAEWADLAVNIQTSTRQVDDLTYPATSGRSMVVDANGLVDANMVKAGPTGAGTAQTARDLGANIDATISSRSTYAGGAVASVTAAVTVGTNNDKSGYSLAALDSMTLHSGTLQSGGTGAVTLAAGASATDNLYQYCLLKIYAGAGAGQTAYITSYVGSTKVANLYPVLQLLTDATSQYAVVAVNGRNGNIIGNMNGDLNGNINGGLTGSVQGNVVGSVQGNVNGNIGGSVASVGTGGITSASFAAGAINAAGVNADLDTYQVDFDFKQSSVAVLDRYEVVFKKNGETLSSGVTVPTIQVIKEADGTDLVASVAMTQIGTSGTYKYEEGTNRAVAGSSYIAIITATIGGSSRTFKKPFGLTN